MEKIKLTIPGMKSPHCQTTVTSALNSLGGTIINISPTLAEVGLTSGLTKETVTRAIEKAGYKVVASDAAV